MVEEVSFLMYEKSIKNFVFLSWCQVEEIKFNLFKAHFVPKLVKAHLSVSPEYKPPDVAVVLYVLLERDNLQ